MHLVFRAHDRVTEELKIWKTNRIVVLTNNKLTASGLRLSSMMDLFTKAKLIKNQVCVLVKEYFHLLMVANMKDFGAKIRPREEVG